MESRGAKQGFSSSIGGPKYATLIGVRGELKSVLKVMRFIGGVLAGRTAALFCCCSFFLYGGFVGNSRAEFKPENLPADTYAYLAIEGVDKALEAFRGSPWGRLIESPGFEPFWKDSLGKFQRKILTPMEKELRADFGDYARLLEGPLMLALIASERSDILLNDSCVLIAETRGDASLVRALLEKQKENWKRDGLEVPVQKVEEVEFSCFTLSREVLERFIEQLGAPEGSFFSDSQSFPTGGVNLWMGLKNRNLILALGDLSVAGKVLRAEADQAPRLKSLQAYVIQERALFRNALGHLWIQPPPIVKALHEVLKRSMETLEAETAAAGKKLNPLFPNPALLLNSLHLETISSIGAASVLADGGLRTRFHLEAPASTRAGLTRLLNTAQMSECRTPDFIPGNALSAWRLRMKLPEALKVLDRVSNEAYPLKELLFLGFEQGYLREAPELNLAEGLLKPLGDDLIFFEVPAELTQSSEPDWAYLVGSSEAELFLSSLQTLSVHTFKAIGLNFPYTLKPLGETSGFYQAEPLKTEGASRPLYLAALPGRGEAPGYIALSSSENLLKLLRSLKEEAGKDLSGKARKTEAPLFFFSEENSLEKSRLLWNQVRGSRTASGDEAQSLSKALPFPLSRLDYGALPDFEECARFFCTATLFSLTVTPQGLDGTVLKVFP